MFSVTGAAPTLGPSFKEHVATVTGGVSVQLSAPSGMALAAGRGLSSDVTSSQGVQAQSSQGVQGLMSVSTERPSSLGAPTTGRDRAFVAA